MAHLSNEAEEKFKILADKTRILQDSINNQIEQFFQTELTDPSITGRVLLIEDKKLRIVLWVDADKL